MGAQFNFEKLVATTASEAVTEGEALIKRAEYDYGHAGYSGSWAECNGVHVADEVCDNETEAEKWLNENADKWGPMLVVSLKEGGFCAGAWCSS